MSGGGTGTYPFEVASGLYTELQAGSYIFIDADYGLNKCQRRSKSTTPLAGVEMHHLMRFSPALAVVPVVHRRDPRCFV